MTRSPADVAQDLGAKASEVAAALYTLDNASDMVFVRTVLDGLKIDPHHPGLLVMRKELGIRSRPVLPFLDRGHALNQFLGRIRHAIRG